MGCWPRRAGASSAAGCCPPAWWSITCWRWRCLLMSPTWRCCGCWWRRCAAPGGLRRLPVKSALVQARARLGPEPLQVLFAKAARPLATPDTPGAWYRRWRLLAVDGATLDVADTADNEAAFGRAKSGRGEGTGAFPQVRVVGLVECGTHATIKAAMGSYATGET